MPIRKGAARWEGSLREGKGTITVGSGAIRGSYSFPSRFEQGEGTNPEELLGTAHASCYSMALAAALAGDGCRPDWIRTQALVHLEQGDHGYRITRIELQTEGKVPGISEESFLEHAARAKATCPVSLALAAVEITLAARLAD